MTTMNTPATAMTLTAPTTWRLDAAHTTVELAVRHMMVSTVRGSVAGIEGTITFDETDLARSSVTVVLDPASIDTHDAKRDTHLRSADFLDVARFPTMTFTSTRIERAGGAYRIVGDLTLHGVTRETILDATFEGRQRDPWGGERAGFTAHALVDRRDFGLSWNQPLEGAGVLLGNDVRISIEVEAVLEA